MAGKRHFPDNGGAEGQDIGLSILKKVKSHEAL
jgi:hypothetical protein